MYPTFQPLSVVKWATDGLGKVQSAPIPAVSKLLPLAPRTEACARGYSTDMQPKMAPYWATCDRLPHAKRDPMGEAPFPGRTCWRDTWARVRLGRPDSSDNLGRYGMMALAGQHGTLWDDHTCCSVCVLPCVRDAMARHGTMDSHVMGARVCVYQSAWNALGHHGTVCRSGSFLLSRPSAGGAEPRYLSVFKSLYRRMG